MQGDGDGDRNVGGAPEDDVVIFEGLFSWWAAWCMMIWILCFICSMVLMVLSTRGSAFEVISEEISFIKAVNPPYGPEEQPNVDATMREINQYFRYRLPQTALYYSLAASSLGLFTVSYFTSFMMLEDIGSKRVNDLGFVIAKGVKVYLYRTIPMILFFCFVFGWYVYIVAGTNNLICFVMGAMLNLISARMGVSVTVHGQTRLAHAMSHELFDAVQIGIRTGSIGGLLATSLGLGGMAGMWLLIRDTTALSGFGSGASIVSFYLRVGGGIFSKGADIGADLIGSLEEHTAEKNHEHKQTEESKVFELQRKMVDLESKRKERFKKGMDHDDEDMMNQLRAMEGEMQDIASQLHPIDYLDAVGENINDVSGTCADLFESMVLILSTSAIIGTKGSHIPHFNSGLPFWIVASGKVGCSVVAYYCQVNERYSSQQIRWSLRVNLFFVIVFVQTIQILVSFQEFWGGTITFDNFWHYCAISLMGQLAPELCIFFGEVFTSVHHAPVRSLALNADLGVVQVVLQGFGQGFLSTAFPAMTMIVCVIMTWQFEGHYGLALLSCSSVSGTGFQGGIASYGAIATNAHKIVHLTTYHAMTRHRANICAALGDATAHAGNTVSAINAFSAVFNVALVLLAQTYTDMDQNYFQVTGSILSNASQAGLVCGILMTMLFAANTMVSCLDTSRAFMKFCQEMPEVSRNEKLPFPMSHIRPLKNLTNWGTLTSMRLVINPMINTLVCPMIGGFFLGVKGLLFLISGSNVLILCLSIFFVNSGQSWVSARKFILFGLLKDANGDVVGPDSKHYENLGVGESIGGPFEDTTGPALNNFIKFVAVFAFVTGGNGKLYSETSENTWYLGFLTVLVSVTLVVISRKGLRLMVQIIQQLTRRQQIAKAYEEGDVVVMEEDHPDDEFDI